MRDRVASFDAALDLLDELQDSLEDEPEIRSTTIRELIAAATSLTDEQRAELTAYGRAAGMWDTGSY